MLQQWEPFRELVSLREAMDRLFEESFVRPERWTARRRREGTVLPLDVYSTPDELVVLASVPGIKPDEVEITIEGDTLTIRGEIKPPAENVDYLMQEREYGPFHRTLLLNVPVQADKAEATFTNGVLTLTIPKAEKIKPKPIKVKTS